MKEVTIYVWGGVVQDVYVPAGVRVTVQDYDNGEDCEEVNEDCQRDEYGFYQEAVYEGGEDEPPQ